jgi:hypothetical protein
MGTIKFDVPHSLSLEEARARVEKLLANWSAKYGIQSTSTGNDAKVAGKVKGIALNAMLRVTSAGVDAEATDPGLLLRGPAKKYLTSQFLACLDPKIPLAEVGKAES